MGKEKLVEGLTLERTCDMLSKKPTLCVDLANRTVEKMALVEFDILRHKITNNSEFYFIMGIEYNSERDTFKCPIRMFRYQTETCSFEYSRTAFGDCITIHSKYEPIVTMVSSPPIESEIVIIHNKLEQVLFNLQKEDKDRDREKENQTKS